MQKNNFRAFFAIEIPEGSKKVVTSIVKKLRGNSHFKKIKWVAPRNLHLTVCFLGKISDDQFRMIDIEIKKIISSFKNFKLEFKSLAPFPSANKFRALVLKPEESETLMELAAAINSSVTACGIELEKRGFRPHLTLGRNEGQTSFTGFDPDSIVSFYVNRIELLKTEPQPGGSVYTVVARYALLDPRVKPEDDK